MARLPGRVLDLVQDRDAPARNHDSQMRTKGEMGVGAAHMRRMDPDQTELRRRRYMLHSLQAINRTDDGDI